MNLTASQRSSLIRLAASLPEGSLDRRTLLKGLQIKASKKTAFRKGDLVTYKGRKYRLLWSGPTRYGDRAKLEFLDGTKNFWVDESKISPARGRGRGRSKKVWFRHWNGKEERMSQEDADMMEDMGHGTQV